MKTSIRNFALLAAGATALSLAAPESATAGNGDIAAGIIGGLIIGGAIANAQQGGYGYVQPQNYAAPVYQQPQCFIKREKYYDPYAGWIVRDVQYCN